MLETTAALNSTPAKTQIAIPIKCLCPKLEKFGSLASINMQNV
jgi:hypothetical protein